MLASVVSRLSRYMSPQFIKFCIVGGLGTITNLLLFFLTVDIGGMSATLMAVVGFVVSAVQNYIFNHYWTFAARTKDTHVSARGFATFLTVSLSALAVNLVVMNVIILSVHLPYKVIAQAFGIGAGTVVNYFGSKHVVFREKN